MFSYLGCQCLLRFECLAVSLAFRRPFAPPRTQSAIVEWEGRHCHRHCHRHRRRCCRLGGVTSRPRRARHTNNVYDPIVRKVFSCVLSNRFLCCFLLSVRLSLTHSVCCLCLFLSVSLFIFAVFPQCLHYSFCLLQLQINETSNYMV